MFSYTYRIYIFQICDYIFVKLCHYYRNPRSRIDSSDSIQFERDENSPTSDTALNSQEPVIEKNGNENEKEETSVKEIQSMYIQMEFCEKSTLRTAIDNGLYEDEDRIWRLFREIIEGLAHIHQQAMIHRDLKPVNIFLDSNDHVKIGDFGLATTNILSNLTHTLEVEKESQLMDKGNVKIIFVCTCIKYMDAIGYTPRFHFYFLLDIHI